MPGFTVDTSETFTINGGDFNVNLTICVFDTVSVIQLCDMTVSSVFENNHFDGFKLYPNPTNGNLYVEHTLIEDYNVKITDVSGKIVYTGFIFKEENHNMLNLEHITQGYYFITFYNHKNQFTQKLLIQK
jgi:hypothetical protein